jgi:hypothetical protein
VLASCLDRRAKPLRPRAPTDLRVDPGEKLHLVATAAPPLPSSVAPATEPPKPYALPARPAVFAQNLAAQSDAVEVLTPNILSLSHWARLGDGELYAAQPPMDWG